MTTTLNASLKGQLFSLPKRPKILYAIQATGNGHISRAIQLLPYLRRYGQVDTFLSGANHSLKVPFDVNFRSKGMSLFFGKCGRLDHWRLLKETQWLHLHREARDLPVEQYDVIINDFEHVTSLACKKKKVPSVQFGHQASFASAATPRPERRSWLGELVLQRYAQATVNIGLHFKPYDRQIFEPVIKDSIRHAAPVDMGHITIYLPAYQQECLLPHLHALPQLHFHLFLPTIERPFKERNITFQPIEKDRFDQSLITCHGIITGGGFETPAEALYLGKRLMSIPIKGQYEQQCNAAALASMGVKVLDDVKAGFSQQILAWLEEERPAVSIEANDIERTLEYLFDTYPSKGQVIPFDPYSYYQPDRLFI